MIAFGQFEFDPATSELRRDGELVHVPPQPAAALRLLTSRPGALISREELQRAIWRDVEHLDFNAGLNFCIGQLRGVLGDRGPSPQFIVAVPKRGYRFVAPVRAIGSAGAAPAPAPAPARTRPWRRWVGVAAAAVLAALSLAGPPLGAKSAGTSDMLAAKAVVRASAGLADVGPTEISRRLRMFNEAIRRDDRFADAYAGRAQTLLIAGQYRVQAPAAAYAEAVAYGRRAVELGPRVALAHAAYGAALIYAARDWAEGGRQLKHAIALDKSLPIAHQWYSRVLSASGRHHEAIAEARQAVALTPGSASAHTDLGWAFFYARQYPDAARSCREAAGLLPAFTPAVECARAAAVEAEPKPATYWRERLQRLEATLAGDVCECEAARMAVPLAHLGDTDRALSALERGADLTSDVVLFAGVHPAFSRIRDTPRFQLLLRRLAVPGS